MVKSFTWHTFTNVVPMVVELHFVSSSIRAYHENAFTFDMYCFNIAMLAMLAKILRVLLWHGTQRNG